MLRPRPVLLAACALVLSAAAPAGAQTRGLTPQDLVSLDRVSDPHVSPDGRRVVYDLRRTDLAANRGVHSLQIVGIDGRGGGEQPSSAGATSPRWGADGRLYYLKGGQVWSANACAPECRALHAAPVTALPLDVDSFRLSPDGRTLVVSMAVFPDAEQPAATKARQDARKADKASGRIYDHLFVRHWDSWADGTRNHLFAVTLGRPSVATSLTPGFDGDVPGKPFGDDADYTISPDGRAVYFSARLAGRTEPVSTNFDLYRVPIDGSAAPVDLTADNKAWDAGPVLSPDGRTIAYRAMKRPGFEADRFTVWLMDVATGCKRELTGGWDRSAGALQWSADGRQLLTTADDDGRTRLFAIDAQTGRVDTWGITKGEGHVSGFDVAPYEKGQYGSVVVVQDSMDAPADLHRVFAPAPTHGYGDEQITHVNQARLAALEMAAYDRFSFKGWNGDTVSGWIVKPVGWRAGARYPVAFLIHGGPQGTWEDGWSYRWNPQVYAARGYGVVMVDFHGSTGYGQAFTDAISGHWGDRPLEDLQKGWAAALKQASWLDGGRACALGASYGGFMTYWIAGVWNAPWRCLVDHDGVFDDRTMGYSTEELWFSTWEHGGPDHLPWRDPAAYERFNPVDHVQDWTKPILVIHSEHDYRIPEEQGLAAFTAAQTRGIESRFLTFPDENHWVLKPANSLLWHKTVLDWLDAHTAAAGA